MSRLRNLLFPIALLFFVETNAQTSRKRKNETCSGSSNIRQVGIFSDSFIEKISQSSANKLSGNFTSHAGYFDIDIATVPSQVTKEDIVEVSQKDGPKIDVDRFVRAVEKGMSTAEAVEKFLQGRSASQHLRAFKKAIEQVSPRAANILGKQCALHASDEEVAGFLKSHYKSCRNTLGFRIELENFLKSGRPIIPTSDFPKECSGVCLNRLRSIGDKFMKEFSLREEKYMADRDSSRVFQELCLPVLESIVHNCGERKGVDMQAIAKSFSETGEVDVIIDAGRLGYIIVDPNDVLGARSHVPHNLLHRGYNAAAAKFLDAFPEHKNLADRYGVKANALLKAKTTDWKLIPKEAAHLAYHESEENASTEPLLLHDRDDLFNHSLKGFYRHGDWDMTQVSFPGYQGKCEIAELDGKAVVEDPATMVEHFLLTNRPVILRDFMRHDKGGIDVLLEKMTRDQLEKDWGHTQWDVSAIPYEKTYTGLDADKLTMSGYIEQVIGGKDNTTVDGIPRYIFSDPVSDGSVDKSAADLFPQNPSWVEKGIPDLLQMGKRSGQFFLGIPGTGAPLHYHTNTAWNGLVYGTKAWVMIPPPHAIFSNIPASKKVFDLAKTGEGIRCVQYAGDVILAPPYWGHLTYNLATSIGMAKEFAIFPTPNKMVEFSNMKRESAVKPSTTPAASKNANPKSHVNKRGIKSNKKSNSGEKVAKTKSRGTSVAKNKKKKSVKGYGFGLKDL